MRGRDATRRGAGRPAFARSRPSHPRYWHQLGAGRGQGPRSPGSPDLQPGRLPRREQKTGRQVESLAAARDDDHLLRLAAHAPQQAQLIGDRPAQRQEPARRAAGRQRLCRPAPARARSRAQSSKGNSPTSASPGASSPERRGGARCCCTKAAARAASIGAAGETPLPRGSACSVAAASSGRSAAT